MTNFGKSIKSSSNSLIKIQLFRTCSSLGILCTPFAYRVNGAEGAYAMILNRFFTLSLLVVLSSTGFGLVTTSDVDDIAGVLNYLFGH